ncbi:MAG: ATP-binding protein [Nannocystaceae bacterium]
MSSEAGQGFYEIGEVLHRGSVHTLVRAIDRRDGARVVLKCLEIEPHGATEELRLRREYELLRSLAIPGVVEAKALIELDGQLRLVLVDAGGTNLTEVLQERGRPPLLGCVDLALQLAEAVGQIHAAGVIHKDLKPRNILVDAAGRVQIIDFGIAARVTREVPTIHGLTGVQGTLAYISPEQTGRTRRGVDHRSDLYSLGATLYELLLGRPPFTARDPAELIHAHIARLPPDPRALDPSLPPALAAMLLRLLAKAPEDRYRSAFGLAHDLRRLRAAIEAGEAAPSFPLGEHDPPLLFQIPERTYGREVEALALEAAVARVRGGAAELVLVRGAAGAGKSSLVRALRPAGVEGRLLYAAGRYDPHRGDAPYSAICEAFDGLLRGLVVEGPESVARWRHTLERALGASAAAIVPLIPQLGVLLGVEVEAPSEGLTPEAARSRLHRAIYTVVRALARPGAPLVLHLDDLPAADVASLDLLVALLGEVGGEGFCCVGTARLADDDGEALTETLRWIAPWCRITTIELGPLPASAIAAMIADTLALPAEEVAPLAAVIADKTLGSPFFAAELLRALHVAGAVRFDPARGRWSYDLAAAAAYPVTDNVVDLLLDRLGALPAAGLTALQRAACVGDEFRPLDLEIDDRLDPAALADGLATATAAGLVEGLGDGFRFAHDRVRETVYATLDPGERPAIHRALARRWRARGGDAEIADDALFALADQTIRGARAIEDPEERHEAGALALRAAERARDSGAFAAAGRLCQHGLEFLSEEAWSKHHVLAYRTLRLACECEFVAGELVRAEAMMRELLRRCASDEERAEALVTRMALHFARNELADVTRVAAEAARLLGEDLPRVGTTRGMILAVVRAQRAIGRRTPGSLVHLPPIRTQRERLLFRAISAATGAAVQTDLRLLTTLAAKAITLAIRDGLDASIAPAFVIHGIAAGAPRRDYALMDAFGRAALEVSQRFPDVGTAAMVRFLYSGMVQSMSHPYRACVAELREGHRVAHEGGYDGVAALCRMGLLTNALHGGLSLEEMRGEAAAALPALERAKMGGMIWVPRVDRGYILALVGESRGLGELSYDGFDEAEVVAKLGGEVAPSTYYHYLNRSMIANLILGRVDVACRRIREADPGIGDALRLFAVFFEYRGHRAIALAAAAGRPGWVERQRLAWELRRTLDQLDAPARSCPANFSALQALVAAELARVTESAEAPAAYERAIHLAREHNTPYREALASERAARYYLERGAGEAGRAYIQRARRAYQRWGARAKVALLDQEFAPRSPRPFVAPATSISDVSITLTAESLGSSSGASTSSSGGGHVVDIASVVKAAQAFAAEVDLKSLAGALMRIVVENAGAERGVLLLSEGGGLVAVAEYSTRTDQVVDLGGAPLDAFDGAPLVLVDRALRGGRAIATDDAATDPSSADDPYVRRRRLRSALAAPLVVQGRAVGLIYLENNLAAGVFTEQRLEVLQILAVQAAIAVEHAGYFRRLDAARQAAEAASVAKSHFLANMSHELRTPLNAILGYTELVQEDVEAEGLESISADLARIKEAGDHLLAIIGDILDLTKIESGTLEIITEPIVVEALLDEVVGLTAVDLGRADNRLVREQAPGLGVIVSDPMKVRQILVNLLGNAAKFTERGVVTLRAVREDDRLRVEIEDTGIGMDEALLARIFEPFTQADPTSTRRYGGVGLGLTICKRLCEQLAGDLEVRSTLGQGSIFRVTLPVRPPAGR